MAFDPLDFHETAVSIPSHEDVTEMREYLVETLEDAGVSVRIDDAGNTLATREGESDGPHIVLNTHIDTVPPHVPLERDGEIVRGRGSCDAKGPLAALLSAFLDAEIASGTVTLAVTPDEEVYSTGAAALDLDADGYIVGEPTGLDICNAAKGRFEGTVEIEGLAAHAAEPESGASAIRAAAPVLQALESYDETVGPPEHDSLGRPTLEPTVIEGGEATNQIPAECRITIDRRSVPPETQQGFREQLSAHLQSWIPDSMDLSFAYTERETPFLEAFATPADSDVVTALRDAGAGEVRPFGAATEASYFAADAPTVVFGPGVLADDEGAVAHAEREYVRRSEVERAGEIATAAVESLLD
ncbi:succinyl-diaminopimelate desuccinylase [Halorientalis sp. IM1011]|uniref:M20 family metallopeptidase n=1 Tax=Halorientalis sp. IM1011 TaxID=1932360 RepID=UPI00097CD19E|nr:M20 family metallopeptidase [Halorientalis sp. IM1011]AQL41951.1 succinyl-diaminopimelate desuccinylase [Halorientalis sp. IM1011]